MSLTRIVLLIVALSGCVSVPEGITPVRNFELERYLGTWYEVARLDHRFERGMRNVSAHYERREDGGVVVTNRGYLIDEQRWEEAIGKAYFVDQPDLGYLKVSFFGPFYGAYVVFELDQADYSKAFVSGPNREYLWYLSRKPTPTQAEKDAFVQKAAALGFDTDQLIWVDQSEPAAVN
ncbi:MAG: lipocalin family protein [Gammaproteobacteria bacterium]|nr:lipocalin family protein [Gammaproteobacteria bacterium]